MRRFVFLTLAALSAVPVLAASAALPATDAVQRTAAYIRTTQQADGGFGGFGDGQSYDAILALRAAGIDVSTVTRDGKSPVDFLEAKASDATTPAGAGKAALAARASGLNPRDVNGTNLIAVIQGAYSSETGLYGADDFTQSLSMLTLACTGGNVPNTAILALRDAQQGVGAWGFEDAPDADTTALAIQALRAAGIPADDATILKALDFLKSTQANDGGWGFDPSASNANSTAFVVQALLSVGVSPESEEFTKNGVDPIEFILSQQQEDGSFLGFDPAFAANQALPALAGRTYCNVPVTPLQSAPPATTTPTATTTTAASTATITATPTGTTAATATRTNTPRATVTRTPIPPKTGSGPDAGGDSASPMLAIALLALAAAGAGLAVANRSR